MTNGCNWEFVAVHWLDAFDGDTGWVTVGDYKPTPQTVVNVGWIWPDCLEGHLTLVASTCPNEYGDIKTVGQVFHIPTQMIDRVIKLVQPVFDTEPSLF